MRRITFSRDAERALRKIPSNMRRIIIAKIQQLAIEPEALSNNVKTLKGAPGFLRLRVGDWRVIFREDGAVLAEIKVAPRGGAYE